MSDDEVTCCPECDNAVSLHLRTNKPSDERWLCRRCGASFRDLKRRSRLSTGGYGDGSTQAALLAADPDDWPRGET